MNEKVFIAVCIIAAIAPLFATYKHFHMLQQNSYYPSRYVKWLYDAYFMRLLLLTVIFCALSLVVKYNIVFSLIIISLYTVAQVFIAFYDRKKSIKRLVITARIKRLYSTALLVQIALFFATIYTKGMTRGIFFSVLILLCVFAPLLILISWLITYPFEKLISFYFISDAKRKINSVRGLKVIGVTGSYGKTSTKFILARILSEKYNVLATPQSYNTPMGVVKTIRESLRAQTQIFVCEMGAKNIGDIKEICDIVNPEIGIISAVGPQHLETFKTVENVFNTKFELYDACKNKGGKVYVNTDSKHIAENLGERECVGYSVSGNGVYAKDISYSREGSVFTICFMDGAEIKVSTKLLGKHNVLNITGAAAIAYDLGVTAEQIRFAISHLEPTEHRLELKGFVNGSVMIDDAYNANPEGCVEAVNVLASFSGMQKVIITPGLVELGDKEYDFNYKLGLAATKVCDHIILVGRRRAIPLNDAVSSTDFDLSRRHIVGSFKEAVEVLSTFADSNTVVLVENDLPDNYLN